MNDLPLEKADLLERSSALLEKIRASNKSTPKPLGQTNLPTDCTTNGHFAESEFDKSEESETGLKYMRNHIVVREPDIVKPEYRPSESLEKARELMRARYLNRHSLDTPKAVPSSRSDRLSNVVSSYRQKTETENADELSPTKRTSRLARLQRRISDTGSSILNNSIKDPLNIVPPASTLSTTNFTSSLSVCTNKELRHDQKELVTNNNNHDISFSAVETKPRSNISNNLVNSHTANFSTISKNESSTEPIGNTSNMAANPIVQSEYGDAASGIDSVTLGRSNSMSLSGLDPVTHGGSDSDESVVTTEEVVFVKQGDNYTVVSDNAQVTDPRITEDLYTDMPPLEGDEYTSNANCLHNTTPSVANDLSRNPKIEFANNVSLENSTVRTKKEREISKDDSLIEFIPNSSEANVIVFTHPMNKDSRSDSLPRSSTQTRNLKTNEQNSKLVTNSGKTPCKTKDIVSIPKTKSIVIPPAFTVKQNKSQPTASRKLTVRKNVVKSAIALNTNNNSKASKTTDNTDQTSEVNDDIQDMDTTTGCSVREVVNKLEQKSTKTKSGATDNEGRSRKNLFERLSQPKHCYAGPPHARQIIESQPKLSVIESTTVAEENTVDNAEEHVPLVHGPSGGSVAPNVTAHEVVQTGSVAPTVITDEVVEAGSVAPSLDSDEVVQPRVYLTEWDPIKLLKKLYEVKLNDETEVDLSRQMITMEGFLEKLPMGKKKSTLLKTWKRRYFKACDGMLHYYESSKSGQPSISIKLMGGTIESLDNRILGVDDSSGHYLMLKCPTDREFLDWKQALESQTLDNSKAMYIRPLLTSPPHQSKKVVIIDLGSTSVRAGILGQKATLPTLFFPNVVAVNKARGHKIAGFAAYAPATRSDSTLIHPIRPSSGVDKFNIDVENLQPIFAKVFSDLKVKSADFTVLLSTPQNLNNAIKEKIIDLLVRQFSVPAICMVQQALLSIYSYKATSGIIVDVGERLEIMAITEGYVIEGGVTRKAYGSLKARDALTAALSEGRYHFFSATENLITRYVLEQACYVSQDYDEDSRACLADRHQFEKVVSLESFDLPTNTYNEVRHDYGMFKSCEGFFNPDLWGADFPTLQLLIHRAIQSCPMDTRRDMARSIYLSGGCTMIPGFSDRLTKELRVLLPETLKVIVHASPQRYHAAFIGACTLASQPFFEPSCITKNEWQEKGADSLRKWATPH